MLPVECLWDFYLSFPSVVLLFQTLNYTHFMAVITFLSYFNLHALPFFFSPPVCFILPLSLLYRPTWIQMNVISIASTIRCWQSVVSSSVLPTVCVCLCVCGCWSQDCVYELRLLSRRGDLLSEPSPSVNVSTAGRFGEQPCSLHICSPPSVWTHSTSSVSLS